jgi:hypothetical protein
MQEAGNATGESNQEPQGHRFTSRFNLVVTRACPFRAPLYLHIKNKVQFTGIHQYNPVKHTGVFCK